MKYILFIFPILFVSCKQKNTPAYYAEEYCNCLQKYRIKNNFDSAHLVCDCDAYLEKEIYYFKVFLDTDKKKYTKATLDSSHKFLEKFFIELDKRCNSLWPNSIPDQMMRPLH